MVRGNVRMMGVSRDGKMSLRDDGLVSGDDEIQCRDGRVESG